MTDLDRRTGHNSGPLGAPDTDCFEHRDRIADRAELSFAFHSPNDLKTLLAGGNR